MLTPTPAKLLTKHLFRLSKQCVLEVINDTALEGDRTNSSGFFFAKNLMLRATNSNGFHEVIPLGKASKY